MTSDLVLEGIKVIGVNTVVLVLIKYFLKNSEDKIKSMKTDMLEMKKETRDKLKTIDTKLQAVEKRLTENSQMLVQEIITVTKMRRDMRSDFDRLMPMEPKENKQVKENFGRIIKIESQQKVDSMLIAKVGRYILKDKENKP